MKETEIVGSFSVCELLKLESSYFKNDEDTPNEGIGWKVKIEGLDDKVKLEEFKEEGIIKGESKLSGSVISFVIPIEWGQKTVTFYCYLNTDENILSPGVTVKIKDHIVAAFFRIDHQTRTYFSINNIMEANGTYNVISELETPSRKKEDPKIGPPVHHHQGLFRDGNFFYISGSTKKSVFKGGQYPSYVYVIEGSQNGKFKHKDIIYFEDGFLKEYRHPGGIQVANNVLAVGFEEYNYNLFSQVGESLVPSNWGMGGSAGKKKVSVTGFFDLTKEKGEMEVNHSRINCDQDYDKKESKYKKNDEILDLDKSRIGLKDEFDIASAVGIAFDDVKKKYIVAVRGHENAIRFYTLDDTRTKVEVAHRKLEKVGEFQNVNLLFDENNDLYMFGMEQGKEGEYCSIYKVNIDNSEEVLLSVWIDQTGKMQYGDYTDKKDNRLKFNLTASRNQPSFHWASCVFIGDKNAKGVMLPQQVKQYQDEGFQGKFMVYAIGGVVQDCADYTKAWDDFSKEYDVAYKRPLVVFKGGGEVYYEPTEEQKEIKFERYWAENFAKYLKNPHIDACYFSEKN